LWRRLQSLRRWKTGSSLRNWDYKDVTKNVLQSKQTAWKATSKGSQNNTPDKALILLSGRDANLVGSFA
jgi:hypothetical protein